MSVKVKIQNFGSKLSGMVIPNLGAFMAWGILTAVGIAIDNEVLRSFIVPMLTYLLPLLIAFAGGNAVYGFRGGVIGAVATIGVIIGSDITMFIGAMILGPSSAWLLKKFDKSIDGKIPTGFELLINNISSGLIGGALAVIGYLFVAPAITSLTGVLAGGVDFLVTHKLLPLTAVFIEPAKVLFLNNAIGQGILTPLGTTQLAQLGKSVMFLLESNPGPGIGVLLAYMFFGKGNSKATAYGAGVIHFFGGIHEIYFPFVLMNPPLVIALIAGGASGTLMFSIFKVGLIGVASPGSIISIMMMAAEGDRLKIIISILVSSIVTFLIAIPLVKRAKNSDSQLKDSVKEMEKMKGKESRISSVFDNQANTNYNLAEVKLIAYACDAGLGSSAMGAGVLQKKLRAAGIDDIKVFHVAVNNLPAECQVIVSHESLMARVKEKQSGCYFVEIVDYLNAPEYEQLIKDIKEAREKASD
ncbi:PTS mannitol transporter subunit IICB [Faecalicatena contorta]|uniref:PTS system mannitol-specific EIICB component n=1 Tax=Faecalicatena contorta TaxID=39482 RepID=A0A315ZSS7_9FIRM|nr:PTS mannitol transporter subunit IICB [Faecalicatena contorta]PWJ48611.1 PTS system D-mannitol-specific IIB component (Fru family) /PTS system D-mannitol-specific IIC component (Fru family) [Faecalicatena contorta]SUQ15347.1 PTS system D-mannitol-specific IIB component, Fru family /PTS system D-mannitol-specific IIC component, Fru family [Faecalicatena contorta]